MNQRPSGYEPDELPTAPPRDKMVEGVGFEPTKRNAADLQSAPFSHSGTPPLKTSGADNRNRTYNLRFTKPLLCLLSYVSMISVTVSIIHETAEFVNCFFTSFLGNPQKIRRILSNRCALQTPIFHHQSRSRCLLQL